MGQISVLSTKADLIRARLNRALTEAYEQLKQALLLYGQTNCERAALGNPLYETVEIKERSFMGVILPLVNIKSPPSKPAYGLRGIGLTLDVTALKIRQSLETIAELAELEVGLFRLLSELQKTIRCLNALGNIYIPPL